MFLARGTTTIMCCLALLPSCQTSRPGNLGPLSQTNRVKPVVSPIQQAPASDLTPPKSTAELAAVTARIYEEAVNVDPSHADAFIVGDFNGDGSQDIAVVVKPGKGMLSKLNSEYANWIREDPFAVGNLAAHANGEQPAKKQMPTVISARDNLLAVIHGYQEAGWRNPKATQTYLLKNAVGKEIIAQNANAFRQEIDKRELPPLRGDVIRETLRDTPGFLYWTGARYAWHPLVN